jgi:peroxiredoxin
VLTIGSTAPSFSLPDADTGEVVDDPWQGGPVVLAFFKTTCPVCVMATPKVQALADAGVRVVAVGEDPPDKLARYAEQHGQGVTTLSEPAPYEVSSAFDLTTVPSLFLVEADGTVRDAVESWDRESWNRFAVLAGGAPVSEPDDGLPSFKPG